MNADFGLEMENDVVKRVTALDVAEIMLNKIALRGYGKKIAEFSGMLGKVMKKIEETKGEG